MKRRSISLKKWTPPQHNSNELTEKAIKLIKDLISDFEKLNEKYGLTKDDLGKVIPAGAFKHLFTTSQFYLMSEKHFTHFYSNENYGYFKDKYEEINKERSDKSQVRHKNIFGYNEVWEVVGESNNNTLLRLHETPKPIALLEIPIRTSTDLNDTVLDPFLGTGSTLMASDYLGRVCYGIELNPEWVNLIIERYKNKKEEDKEDFKIIRIRNGNSEEIYDRKK